MEKRIPVLVVSGFLGAGKTTLVRHLLHDAQRTGVRVAVVSNEFGALGIDKALLGEGEEAYVELEGGCVCCQLSDTLLDTLQMLWERVRPDRIIVETSGVALPFDTQLNLWREPVSAWVDDDMAVVVVNAEQLMEGRDLEGTFEDQVSSADLLLLNKIDLIPPEALGRVEAMLHALAPDTPLVQSIQGSIDPAVLFPPDLAGIRSQRRTARCRTATASARHVSCPGNLCRRWASSPMCSASASGVLGHCVPKALCRRHRGCDSSRGWDGGLNSQR